MNPGQSKVTIAQRTANAAELHKVCNVVQIALQTQLGAFPEEQREAAAQPLGISLDASSGNHAALVKINNAIRSGLVHGFICESFGAVEAVKRTERAKFHAQSTPKVEVTAKPQGRGLVGMTIEIEANHSRHRGLTAEFEEELTEALATEMKLLSMELTGAVGKISYSGHLSAVR